MPRLVNAVPKYRKHRASGQAVVSIGGKDHYLGPHGTKASKMLYDRLVAEWLAGGRALPAPDATSLTVTELVHRWWKHAKDYYRRRDGSSTYSAENTRSAIRILRALYGTMPVDDFGPLALKAVRQKFIEEGWSRSYINQNVDKLRRIFRWGCSEELVSGETVRRLNTVRGLRKGQQGVPESEPVRPVELDVVEATVPHLPAIVADMVRVQMLTGMRPGEVCRLRPCDIDQSRDVWEYRPDGHKTEHHGKERVVYIGPEGQAVLHRYLLRDETTHCFRPVEVVEQQRSARTAARTTPLSCGNRPGSNRVRSPRRSAGERYDTDSYRRALHRACDRAFPPPGSLAKRPDETHRAYEARLSEEQQAELRAWQDEHRWAPNQLRHTTGTSVRKRFGLEAAQLILGHAAADVTQVYAERDADKAREVVRLIG